jgi:hypothetical protein
MRCRPGSEYFPIPDLDISPIPDLGVKKAQKLSKLSLSATFSKESTVLQSFTAQKRKKLAQPEQEGCSNLIFFATNNIFFPGCGNPSIECLNLI